MIVRFLYWLLSNSFFVISGFILLYVVYVCVVIGGRVVYVYYKKGKAIDINGKYATASPVKDH